MLRRNVLVICVAAVFALSLAACSSNKATDLPDTDPTTEDTATQTDNTEDVETPVVEDTRDAEPMPVLDDVFFDFDKSALTGGAKRKLQNNARQLKDASSASITIEGHCDERGTNSYNLALGERRAKAARDYLVSLGIPASRMTTISYGEEQAFATGHTEEAWTLNRRAHFVITSR